MQYTRGSSAKRGVYAGKRKRGKSLATVCKIALEILLVAEFLLLLRIQGEIGFFDGMCDTITWIRQKWRTAESWSRADGKPEYVGIQVVDADGDFEGADASGHAADTVRRDAEGVIPGSYADLYGLEEVEPPRTRTRREVQERLKNLGRDSEVIEEIRQNMDAYPEKLLEALANNPEMADYVRGYGGLEDAASGGLTEEELSAAYPLFLQWDPRWGYVKYGDGNGIGLAGCGPTCLAMAMFYLTGEEDLTPDRIAAYSLENGYYVEGTGTSWALFNDLPAAYGIGVRECLASEHELKTALDNGSVVICSMRPGDFTTAGHFIVIYGYDKDGFLVNDPNCVARSMRHWPWETIGDQMKHVWVVG